MLENAWIIPLIPAASFFLILFFGKRLPRKGSELGIAAVGIAFVLAIATNVQWFDHVEDAGHGESEEHSEEVVEDDHEVAVAALGFADGSIHGTGYALDGEAATPTQDGDHGDEAPAGEGEEHA